MYSYSCKLYLQAKEDLRSDEDIFAEKAKELTSLKARIEELVRYWHHNRFPDREFYHNSLSNFLTSQQKLYVVMAYQNASWCSSDEGSQHIFYTDLICYLIFPHTSCLFKNYSWPVLLVNPLLSTCPVLLLGIVLQSNLF